jgi:hypothetical protein
VGQRLAARAPARGPGPLRLFRFLIYGLVLASSGAQYAVVPILPVYAHRFGLSGLQQGMVLGATGFATLAVSVPAGALSDRFGARRLTLWAGWLMSIALFTQAMAGSFPVLLAARLGFGIGFAVVWTAGLSWLAEAAPGGPGPRRDGRQRRGRRRGRAGPVRGGRPVLRPDEPVPRRGRGLRRAHPGPRSAPDAGRRARALRRMGTSLRAATADRRTIVAAAAIVTAGGTTGVSALLVPAELHVAGASPGQIGLVFAGGRGAVRGGELAHHRRGPPGRAPAGDHGGHAGPGARPLAGHRDLGAFCPGGDAVRHHRRALAAMDGQLSPGRRRVGAERGPASASCWGCSTGCGRGRFCWARWRRGWRPTGSAPRPSSG